MKKFFQYLFFTVSAGFIFQSCEPEPSKPSGMATEDSIYFFVDGLMKYWYLWNDSLPNVDYLSYSDPQDLMEDLRIDIDQWSFVDKLETVNSMFNEGEDFGFGFYLGWDENPPSMSSNLRVMIVYNNTDAYAAGIRRGWILQKMNDVDVKEMTSYDEFFSTDPATIKFTFYDEFDLMHKITLSKKTYNMNGVLYSNTYNVSGAITGYMVFQSFLDYSKTELEQTLDFFKVSGIKELVIDLRFNGGGSVSIAEELANSIITSSKVGQTFFDFKHNTDRSAENDTIILFKNSIRNLNLDRVFFITNEYSASASELVINGLEPHMEVLQIGETTYGKPVAMYGFEFHGWLAYPVTAKSVNSDGFGDYYSGLAPDKTIVDEFRFDWGDENEPALSQAFYYISHGTFDNTVFSLNVKSASTNIIGNNKLRKNLLLMDR